MLNQRGFSVQVQVASAGTHPIYPQSPPDSRSQKRAALRGYNISDISARTLCAQDFEEYDLILVMDANNLKHVQSVSPAQHLQKIGLLAEYCSRHSVSEIPDPYFGGVAAFEVVLDLIEDACENLLLQLIRKS
jgi:protein-tyrosine phosphatase